MLRPKAYLQKCRNVRHLRIPRGECFEAVQLASRIAVSDFFFLTGVNLVRAAANSTPHPTPKLSIVNRRPAWGDTVIGCDPFGESTLDEINILRD